MAKQVDYDKLYQVQNEILDIIFSKESIRFKDV